MKRQKIQVRMYKLRNTATMGLPDIRICTTPKDMQHIYQANPKHLTSKHACHVAD